MPSAIITGATHGIGAAIAEKLAQEGFSLAVCARNQNDLEQLKAKLTAAGAAAVFAKAADLSHSGAAKAFGDDACAALGVPDILVNNAGIFLPGNIADEEEGQLERMMRINLYAAYELTRTLLPGMKQRRSGHIFNMCSVASLKAYPQGGSYSISKYALLGFSDNLREELKADNIKVTALCPGAVKSRSWDGSGVPDERIMPAKDIAAVLWTAYNLSANTNLETVILRPQLGDL